MLARTRGVTMAFLVMSFAGTFSSVAQHGPFLQEFGEPILRNVSAVGSLSEFLGFPPNLESNTSLLVNADANGLAQFAAPLNNINEVAAAPPYEMVSLTFSTFVLAVPSTSSSDVLYLAGVAGAHALPSQFPANHIDLSSFVPLHATDDLATSVAWRTEYHDAMDSFEPRGGICPPSNQPTHTCQEQCDREATVAYCRNEEDYRRDWERTFRNGGINLAACVPAAAVGGGIGSAIPGIGTLAGALFGFGACLLTVTTSTTVALVDNSDDRFRARERIVEDNQRCRSDCP